MTLEWIRRRDSALDQHLRTYLFTTAPITEIEAAAESGGEEGSASNTPGELTRHSDGSLGIGSLRGRA